VQEANVEQDGGAVARRHEVRKNQSGDKAREVYGVGQDTHAEIGDGQDDNDAGEDDPLEGLNGQTKAEIATYKEQPGYEFDQRIHWRDGQRAGATFAAKPQPTEDGDVVVRLDGCQAAWAARAGRNDGLALWNARDAHIEKAANYDSKKKKEEEDHGLTVPQWRTGLKKRRGWRVGWLTRCVRNRGDSCSSPATD